MMAQSGETADSGNSVRGSPQSQQHGSPGRCGGRLQLTVHVIDDEEPVRETPVEVLSIHGYSVVTAGSVAEAEEARE